VTCGIYCIENLIDGKKYIGKDVRINRELRIKVHKNELRNNRHVNIYLQRAWNKYGENNFKFYVVEICQRRSLVKKEKYYIREWCTKAPAGYNMTDGGDGMLNPSQEVREKWSKQRIGRKASEETKMKMSKSGIGKHLGVVVKKETRLKISKSLAGRKKGGTSKYIGVRFHDNGWEVEFGLLGKYIYVGRYISEISAAIAYDEYIINNNIDRPLNFPKDDF
jgi:group I intron endonuclease